MFILWSSIDLGKYRLLVEQGLRQVGGWGEGLRGEAGGSRRGRAQAPYGLLHTFEPFDQSGEET